MNRSQGLAETGAQLRALIGNETHVSGWLTIDQARIDAFAHATNDHQWIHTDPGRAARGPFGTTIAHGYLTLSLYPFLRGLVAEDAVVAPGVKSVVNYGLNKVRFPAPVKVGARIRARCKLLAVDDVPGGLQMTEQYSVEIEGEPKPACVAEGIMRLMF
jgi:acyl dehydratase